MADRTKQDLWGLLKEAGWKPPLNKTYVSFTADQLEIEYNTVVANAIVNGEATPEDVTTNYNDPDFDREGSFDEWASAVESAPPAPTPTAVQKAPESATSPQSADPFAGVPRTDVADQVAGLRMQTHGADDPVRIDSHGRIWYQDEVRKPATPRPRARRVLQYKDPGVKTIENRNQLGLLEESFEVAGDEVQDMTVKITLPSWQVGIYKDPSMPFRIHVYNDVRGFSRRDVVKYYGGSDHVPSTVKTVYVGSDLCYDIKSVRDTIDREYRERVLRIGSLS